MVEEKPEMKLEKQRHFTVQKRKNYSRSCRLRNFKIPCYTKKQMRILYPKNDFEIAAEYIPKSKKKQADILIYGKTVLPLNNYGENSRIVYAEKGFVAVDKGEDSYIVLLGNVLIKRIAALFFCIAVLTTGILFAVKLTTQSGEIIPTTGSTQSPVSVELESGAVDWEGIKVSETSSAAEGIRIPGFKSITIQADTTEVSVNFQNPAANNCYFVIRLVLLDTGETLYESKMIEPGKGLYNVTLSRALEAGTYSAQLQYEPYDLITLTRLNGAVINLDLIAE